MFGGTTEGVNISRWDGSSWTRLGGSEDVTTDFTQAQIDVMFLDESTDPDSLLVGGTAIIPLDDLGTLNPRAVIQWNGQNWQPAEQAFDGKIENIVARDGPSGLEVYFAGEFTTGFGKRINRLAFWDGNEGSALGAGLELSSTISDFAFFDDGNSEELYVTGLFTPVGGGAPVNIAKWSGGLWSGVGDAELLKAGQALSTPVDLEVFNDGSGTALWVAGDFGQIREGATIRNSGKLASWDGNSWITHHLPTSSFGDRVVEMGIIEEGPDRGLYIVGNFRITTLPGGFVHDLVVWDGETFHSPGDFEEALDTNIVNQIGTFESSDGWELFVGGTISEAGSNPTTNIGVMRDGEWELLPLPAGFNYRSSGSQFAKKADIAPFDDGFGPILYVSIPLVGSSGDQYAWMRWTGFEWDIIGPEAIDGASANLFPIDINGMPVLLRGESSLFADRDTILEWERASGPCN